jgi:hypothetical protein
MGSTRRRFTDEYNPISATLMGLVLVRHPTQLVVGERKRLAARISRRQR